MSRCSPWPRGWRRWTSLLLVATSSAWGQEAMVEPRWLRLNIPQASLGMEVEGMREDVTQRGVQSTHEYLSLIPLLGVRSQGSLYHPNLLSFDVSGEGGYGWMTDRVRSPGFDQTRDQSEELLRYQVLANLLASKPYNASFYASQDHTYQNYGFFDTAVVDSQRRGGRLGWSTDSFSLDADIGYREERSVSSTGTSDVSDTFARFRGNHYREFGTTTLSYNFDDFGNSVNGNPAQNSLSHSIGATDAETFGSRKHITVATGLSYSEYGYLDRLTKTIHANENVTIQHLENLDSFYNVNYNHSTYEPVTSSVLQGMGGLRHQLYESLNSSVDLHGTTDSTTSAFNDSSNDRYGVGLREDYTKRLGAWGRLSLGGSMVADHENHQAANGVIQTAINEPHTLYLTTNPSYRPAYLNNPQVIVPTIQVMGPAGIATENLDYQVIPSGSRTEIRLLFNSPVLRDGDRVEVTYQSASLFNASYESFSGSAQIRLDLFDRFGVFGRMNWLDNNAPPEAVTENLLDLVAGMDVTWRWLRAGGEFERYDSNFADFRAYRFFQNFNFPLDTGSSLRLDFGQTFYRYEDDRRETRYQFIGRFDTQLDTWLLWNLEAGYHLQDIYGTTENLAMARTGITATWGKLSLKAGYHYNYQLTSQVVTTEQRNRHFLYLYAKRIF